MFCVFFFFKQKTAYEMRISDWSSDVCSSDLSWIGAGQLCRHLRRRHRYRDGRGAARAGRGAILFDKSCREGHWPRPIDGSRSRSAVWRGVDARKCRRDWDGCFDLASGRSEEHTSELQSLMRISYAVFCLKQKIHPKLYTPTHAHYKSYSE